MEVLRRLDVSCIPRVCFLLIIIIVFFFDVLSITIVVVHEDEGGRRSDQEIISEDERRKRKLRLLRRKAVNGSTRIKQTLRKRSTRVVHCQFAAISTEEFLDEEEEKAVNAFRQVLIERDMLPAWHDDYHTMLRFSSTSGFQFKVRKNLKSESLFHELIWIYSWVFFPYFMI